MNDKLSIPPWQRRGWLTIALVIAVALLLSLGGENTELLLQFDRVAIHSGQVWRLVTGHIVHGSAQHTLVNVLGVALMAALFNHAYNFKGWMVIIVCGVIFIDMGFWFLMPNLQWYVGLSGVLHAVLAAGAVAWWRTEPKPLAALLTSIMIGKLVWEQTQGALPLSGNLIVVVNAHLYGEVGGFVGAILCSKKMLYSGTDITQL